MAQSCCFGTWEWGALQDQTRPHRGRYGSRRRWCPASLRWEHCGSSCGSCGRTVRPGRRDPGPVVKLTRGGPGQHHGPEDQLAQSGSPSPSPALGNNLGAGLEDRGTHCVRYMFMKYSTAMKAQRLLLQTGGSQRRYDKQATQTRLTKGEAPLPPSVLFPSLAPDFPTSPRVPPSRPPCTCGCNLAPVLHPSRCPRCPQVGAAA